jgi:hypothetical protein
MFQSIYPVEDRPPELQCEHWVNNLDPAVFLAMMESWIKKQRREDRADELFRKDAALPTRQFDGGPDNCADLLHQARYLETRCIRIIFGAIWEVGPGPDPALYASRDLFDLKSPDPRIRIRVHI